MGSLLKCIVVDPAMGDGEGRGWVSLAPLAFQDKGAPQAPPLDLLLMLQMTQILFK